ncbi:MAG: ricin-type beta-trefoil lectin domain protein, partial [Actinobacteria bacterium]|nr:ricin-type beta-trefoil lectin domain protein [Actinomycetota bacterium]
CLEDYLNRTRNGNPIVTRTCNGSAQQNWTLVQDNTMRIHGKCLTLSSGHTVLESCNGSAAQHWRVGTGGALVNASTGKCLAGSATANGAQAWTGGCTAGATNKEWKLVGGPVLAGTPGKCLDDTGNVKAVGNKVVTSPCNDSAEQNWLVKPDGSIRIHSMCLDASSGVTVLNSCTSSSPPPQWQIPASGSGSNLVSGGQCLALQGDGLQAKTVTCAAGDPTMTWRIR